MARKKEQQRKREEWGYQLWSLYDPRPPLKNQAESWRIQVTFKKVSSSRRGREDGMANRSRSSLSPSQETRGYPAELQLKRGAKVSDSLFRI